MTNPLIQIKNFIEDVRNSKKQMKDLQDFKTAQRKEIQDFKTALEKERSKKNSHHNEGNRFANM